MVMNMQEAMPSSVAWLFLRMTFGFKKGRFLNRL